MPDIKLVVSDMDGTFLSPNKNISPAAFDAVAALRRHGAAFTFITGRPRFPALHYAELLALTMPVVACNGALIFQDEDTYFRRTFPLAPLRAFLQCAHADGLTVLYSLHDIEYAFADTHWTAHHRTLGRDIAVRPVADGEWCALEVEKINVFAREDGAGFAALIPFIRTLRETHSISLYGWNGCEIVADKLNKATGLRELCKLYNISLDQVLAIGDSSNDDPMLIAAGIGCAVQNAAPETKSVANYVCENSFGEGVAEAIERFVFNS